MLNCLELRDFRCFQRLELDFSEGAHFFVGPNAVGKTSILEAICVLLRLASPRASHLGTLGRLGTPSFLLRGEFAGREIEFSARFQSTTDAATPAPTVKKVLRLDDVEQKQSRDYLKLARLVYFGNQDVELVRGGSEGRRRFMDFLGAQIEPLYRSSLSAYDRALRARNRLLKQMPIPWAQVAAYEIPLIEAGNMLTELRGHLVRELAPWAAQGQIEISGLATEVLTLSYRSGLRDTPFAEALEKARSEDARLRQTTVGPHRDDLVLTLNHQPATSFASEGQQRTIALALKLAQIGLLTSASQSKEPPILLLDDIFGELDPARRGRLLESLPRDAQRFLTTTSLAWRDAAEKGQVWRLIPGGRVEMADQQN